jgi:hypothetical protein
VSGPTPEERAELLRLEADAADRRRRRELLEAEAHNAAIRKAYREWRGIPEPPTKGPGPVTTAAEVEEARQYLKAHGQDSGERAIAKYLGVSRDAVRWAEGKGRRG